MSLRAAIAATFVVALVAVAAAALAASGSRPRTTRVSVSSSGAQAHRGTVLMSLSANGRFAAFDSDSGNLVAHDTNRRVDVFVRDLKTHRTRRVSVGPSGKQGNAESSEPTISANGRYVAFASRASNLVAGRDRNGHTSDVYVHDRKAHRTIRVSVDSSGKQYAGWSGSAMISADGHSVAFRSGNKLARNDANRWRDIYVRDLVGHRTKLVSVGVNDSPADYTSDEPSISGDGRKVAFASHATNLVPHDGPLEDVYVRDRDRGRTRRVSVTSDGTRANGASYRPTISADGDFVAFTSAASNLCPGDTNRTGDVFLHNLVSHTTECLSVSLSGAAGNDVSGADWHTLSRHGDFVAFSSDASDLVRGDTNRKSDAFVRDVRNHKTRRVSVSNAGTQGNSGSFARSISLDGRFVGFGSFASNLVSGDTNRAPDVFRRGPLRP